MIIVLYCINFVQNISECHLSNFKHSRELKKSITHLENFGPLASLTSASEALLSTILPACPVTRRPHRRIRI
jgi:hypothetical protein